MMKSGPMMLGRRKLLAASTAGLAATPVLLAGCTLDTSSYPYPPLQHASVDLDRFMGKWYINGHIPYFAEANYVGSYAVYTKRPDGAIDDQYNAYPKTFSAKLFQFTSVDQVEPGTDDAIWRVTALSGTVGVPYVIMHIEPDYSAFMAGFPNRSLGWIFAREKRMDPAVYQAMLERFYHQGYDARQFRRVAQYPSQIGKAGFETVT